MDKITLNTEKIISDYNRIYSGPGIRTNSAYYRWLIGLLKPKQGSSLLDVSCGEGIFLKEFVRSVKGARVCGLDISDKALTKSKGNVDSAGLVNADGQFIPFKDGTFDYVTCLGSLEHYLDPEKGMRELCRVGKEGAGFCIVLPNSVSVDFLLHVVKYGAKPVDDFQIIERTATREEWTGLLEKNGFRITKVYGSNLWPELFQEGSFKVKSLGKYFRRKFVKVFCPVNLAREFVFICRKK
jgi:ubiquinone/menaquinone biosynthesis C-methylase UbiE